MLVSVVYHFFFHVTLPAIPFSTLNFVQEKKEKLFHLYSVNSLLLYLVNNDVLLKCFSIRLLT